MKFTITNSNKSTSIEIPDSGFYDESNPDIPRPLRPNTRDLTGMKFGEWTVLYYVGCKQNSRHNSWRCVCSCGTMSTVWSSELLNGGSKSCGCRRNRIHGLCYDPIYSVWTQMIARCTNSNTADYARYGRRGITVCQEWLSDVHKFIVWAEANGYMQGLQLDRIDNDGNYCPENCRFIDRKTNCRNRRDTVFVKYKGQTRKLIEVCEELNLPIKIIRNRRERGWPDKHLFLPV